MKNDEFTLEIHCWGDGCGQVRVATGHIDREVVRRLIRALPYVVAIMCDDERPLAAARGEGAE